VFLLPCLEHKHNIYANVHQGLTETLARIATDSIATPLFVKRNGHHIAAALGKSNGPGYV
jgi:hypothetical protein